MGFSAQSDNMFVCLLFLLVFCRVSVVLSYSNDVSTVWCRRCMAKEETGRFEDGNEASFEFSLDPVTLGWLWSCRGSFALKQLSRMKTQKHEDVVEDEFLAGASVPPCVVVRPSRRRDRP